MKGHALYLFLVSLLLLAQAVGAGTVTLTGTCQNLAVNGNTIVFTISNSGNDTAYGMVVTPMLQNVQPSISSYPINNLGPGAAITINVSVRNLVEKGTSGAYFSTAYQQGTSIFTAVFPCLISYFNTTVSQVFIRPNVSTVVDGSATIKALVFNKGASAINANVSLVLPPTFSYTSGKYFSILLLPYAASNATFYVNFPRGLQASYAGAALASYSKDNLSYAALSTFVVSAPQQTADLSFLLLASAIVAVLAILGLILFSLIRKKQVR